MFQQVIIPEALQKFLNFNDLKSLININKYIHNMFFPILCKRILWRLCNLPQDLHFVHRLKLFSWIRFKQFINFPNIKQLQITGFLPREMCSFPDTLVSLEIGNFFIGPMFGLPYNLKRLKFGNWCEVNLCGLPKKLEELIFGDDCTVKLTNCVFLSNLQKIKFGAEFVGDLEPLSSLGLKGICFKYFNGEINLPKRA
jgi:hypothetical protein